MIRQKIYTASGIILKRRNWGEADKIITVFTLEYGKLRLVAKGVRKLISRRSGHLEPFRSIRITVHVGRNMDIITEAVSEMAARDENNLDSIGSAYFICELVDRLTPDAEKHSDIYYMLKDSLDYIDRNPASSDWPGFMDTFANRLLKILGYLRPDRMLNHDEIVPYIENIIERPLKSPKIINRIRLGD
jgi:DNA repair protein RecO (recombination protein O)